VIRARLQVALVGRNMCSSSFNASVPHVSFQKYRNGNTITDNCVMYEIRVVRFTRK